MLADGLFEVSGEPLMLALECGHQLLEELLLIWDRIVNLQAHVSFEEGLQDLAVKALVSVIN